MPDDWKVLTNELVSVLKSAESYLVVRSQGAKEQAEQERVQELLQEVDEWLNKTREAQGWYQTHGSVQILNQNPDSLLFISDELQSTSNVLGQLHEYYELSQVNQAFTQLQQCVNHFFSTGPHGPGTGRPWPKYP